MAGEIVPPPFVWRTVLTMQIRPIGPLDLAATAALLSETLALAHANAAWLQGLTLDDPTCESEIALLAVDREAVIGCCLGCRRDDRAVIKLFAVSPAARRQGIATALFSALEQASRDKALQRIVVGGVAPNYALPGVPLASISAIGFLERAGYRSDRSARVDLIVDLDDVDLDCQPAVARLAAQGLTLQRATPERVPEAAAFALGQFSSSWEWEVGRSAQFQPIPLFVALDGDEVVAFAAYEVSGPGRFGPTGTLPTFRRRGIGSTLMRMCLADMKTRGDCSCTIGWAGPIGYYARAVNARMGPAFWVYEKDLHNQAS